MKENEASAGTTSIKGTRENIQKTRMEMDKTLKELQKKFSPNEIIDNVSHWLKRSDFKSFLSDIKEVIVGNPVPLVLVGVGATLLVREGVRGRSGERSGANRKQTQNHKKHHEHQQNQQNLQKNSEIILPAGSKMAEKGEHLQEAGEKIFEKVGHKLQSMRDVAMEKTQNLKHATQDVKNKTTHLAQDSLHKAQEVWQTSQDKGIRMVNEHPVASGAVSLGLGLIIGSVLLSSWNSPRPLLG